MDINLYATEKIAAERLAALRAAGTQAVLVRSVRIGSRGVRPMIGEALIRLGRWLAPDDAPVTPNAGVRVARRA